jgi:DNA-binding NtrC family response regulator
MNQKFLVINCDETDVEELRQRLGGRQVVSCSSLDEIARYLPSRAHAVLVTTTSASAPVRQHTEMNGSMVSSQPINTHVATEMVNPEGVDELVERILEQNNGHAKTLAARVDMLEQKIIEYSLNRNGQHRKETAAELGISRVTLYNKMKKFGLLD